MILVLRFNCVQLIIPIFVIALFFSFLVHCASIDKYSRVVVAVVVVICSSCNGHPSYAAAELVIYSIVVLYLFQSSSSIIFS